MYHSMMTSFAFGIILLLTLGCSRPAAFNSAAQVNTDESYLYALKGREHKVYFRALLRTRYTQLIDLKNKNLLYDIQQLTPFLFGPLTHRSIGGVQKGERVQPLTDLAYVEAGRVVVPFDYDGTWLIQRDDQESLQLPFPFSIADIENSNWKSCTETDSAEHSTWSFLWYFWDPSRSGCTQKLGKEYQMIDVQIKEETVQTKNTYPEYQKMIRRVNGIPTFEMTFAFGYVEDSANPNPFTDSDYGVQQFQTFYRQLKTQLLPLGFKESPLLQNEYGPGSTKIGVLFTGNRNGTVIKVSVVAAAGVDQMDIFATSFARKHEGFFGWFGHSRVGSGFDAQVFRNKVRFHPERFSISPNYQLVYWAGCNSYSYYTLPFFEMKAELGPEADPAGTKNLDIISNTLPSLFAFNAPNANIVFQALFNWEKPASYQSIIDDLETFASRWNYDVMVNVLGDEDNN